MGRTIEVPLSQVTGNDNHDDVTVLVTYSVELDEQAQRTSNPFAYRVVGYIVDSYRMEIVSGPAWFDRVALAGVEFGLSGSEQEEEFLNWLGLHAWEEDKGEPATTAHP